MGGAIAIVTHHWKSFAIRSIPCPMGSELINVLDIAVGPYNIGSINPYSLSTLLDKGPALIYRRVADYIKVKTSPAWAKKLELQKYIFAYAIPKDLDPAAKTLAHQPTWWTSLLFYNKIRRVCANKEANYMEVDIKAATDNHITFQDFNKSLNTIFNRGVPGPTAAAAKLVKAWSPEAKQ
jgi:hypothetical protein